MKWNLQSLFTGESVHLPIRDELDFTEFEFQGQHPFPDPVLVEGAASAAGGIVILRATVTYQFHGCCDRCLAPFERDGRFNAEHILVTSTEEESDDLVVLDQFMLDLDDLIQADLWMDLPTKSLCRNDCRGLCPHCGKDLNEGLCGCSEKEVDPRLEALRQWID